MRQKEEYAAFFCKFPVLEFQVHLSGDYWSVGLEHDCVFIRE